MLASRSLRRRALALAVAATLAACSQAPPAEVPPAEAPEAAVVLEPVPAAVAAPAPETERKPASAPETAAATSPQRGDATVVAVASPQPKARTLWEAAVEARDRRAQSPRPRVSVTDENLHEYQDAELTFADPRPEPEAAEAGAEKEGTAEEDTAADADARDEAYWRSRVRDLRLRLRAAVDELADLDERAAGLRRSFYAADDPYVRDTEIKPAWDRALDRAEELRRELVLLSRQLEDALEEGRQAGALPGWLREGIELEPEPEELPPPRTREHEPGEPRVIEIEEPPARR